MPITLEVPRELRACCEGQSQLSLSVGNVQGILEELESRHPALYRHVCDETGRLRRHLNLFVNSSHMRERQGLETKLESGDVVFILPAVSGG